MTGCSRVNAQLCQTRRLYPPIPADFSLRAHPAYPHESIQGVPLLSSFRVITEKQAGWKGRSKMCAKPFFSIFCSSVFCDIRTGIGIQFECFTFEIGMWVAREKYDNAKVYFFLSWEIFVKCCVENLESRKIV